MGGLITQLPSDNTLRTTDWPTTFLTQHSFGHIPRWEIGFYYMWQPKAGLTNIQEQYIADTIQC